MNDKFILKSKTIWGLLIAAAPQVAMLMGWNFGVEDAAELNTHVENLVSLIGLALAFFGRVKAQQNLTL